MPEPSKFVLDEETRSPELAEMHKRWNAGGAYCIVCWIAPKREANSFCSSYCEKKYDQLTEGEFVG